MRHTRSEWTERELRTLRTMKEQRCSEEEIAQRLGRTLGSVASKWKLINKAEKEAADNGGSRSAA